MIIKGTEIHKLRGKYAFWDSGVDVYDTSSWL